MTQTLSMIALVVADYDEAIAWYTGVLGFTLIEDTAMAEGKRWVVIAPPGEGAAASGSRLLLARASNEEQASRVGNQTGGRVFLFLRTDDFGRDYAALLARGVEFVEKPRHEAYGTVVVFRDLYGNKWDLVGPRE